jgi:hypothetical protein
MLSSIAALLLFVLVLGHTGCGGGATPRTVLFEDDHDSVNLPGSSWNADTDRIAFSSDRVGGEEIWTMAPDGAGAFRVTWHGEATSYLEPSSTRRKAEVNRLESNNHWYRLSLGLARPRALQYWR